MNKSGKIVKVIILSIVGVCIVFGVLVGTMYLWNWLVPTLFNGPVINFWQTLGLLALSRILFGRWGGGCKHKHKHAAGPGKHYWKERWNNMNADEREKFRQKLKDKWCYRQEDTPVQNPGTAND